MTADELRELADWLAADDYAAQDRRRAAAHLRTCADALDAGPVAWTLQETLDKRETTHRAYLWFVDPQNSAWAALYPVAMPAPSQPSSNACQLPEPMTDAEVHSLLDDISHLPSDFVVREIEATVIKRVKEANDDR